MKRSLTDCSWETFWYESHLVPFLAFVSVLTPYFTTHTQMAALQRVRAFQSSSLSKGSHPTLVVPVACPVNKARSLRCAAEKEEQQAASTASPSASTPQAPVPPAAAATEAKPPLLQKGQGTAIVTGVISVVFGVAYLVLVFFLDSRGGEMLPPPPEAFGP